MAESLEARDERVIKKLVAALVEMETQRTEAADLLRALNKSIPAMYRHIAGQNWHELRGVLSARDVESLSSVSPDISAEVEDRVEDELR
jgi:hypothetical protein